MEYTAIYTAFGSKNRRTAFETAARKAASEREGSKFDNKLDELCQDLITVEMKVDAEELAGAVKKALAELPSVMKDHGKAIDCVVYGKSYLSPHARERAKPESKADLSAPVAVAFIRDGEIQFTL